MVLNQGHLGVRECVMVVSVTGMDAKQNSFKITILWFSCKMKQNGDIALNRNFGKS